MAEPTGNPPAEGRPIHGFRGDDLGLRTLEVQYHPLLAYGGTSTSGIPWVPSADYDTLARQLKRERAEMHGLADGLARELERVQKAFDRLKDDDDRRDVEARAENAVLTGRLDVEAADAWAEEADLAAQRVQGAIAHLEPQEMTPEEHAAVVQAYASLSRAYAALASVRLAATTGREIHDAYGRLRDALDPADAALAEHLTADESGGGHGMDGPVAGFTVEETHDSSHTYRDGVPSDAEQPGLTHTIEDHKRAERAGYDLIRRVE